MAKSRPPFDREWLSGYVDAELSDEQRAEVEWWMEHDDDIRAEVAMLREMGNVIRQLPKAQLGKQFVDRVLEEIDQDSSHSSANTSAAPESPGKPSGGSVGGGAAWMMGRRRWLSVVSGIVAASLVLTVINWNNSIKIGSIANAPATGSARPAPTWGADSEAEVDESTTEEENESVNQTEERLSEATEGRLRVEPLGTRMEQELGRDRDDNDTASNDTYDFAEPDLSTLSDSNSTDNFSQQPAVPPTTLNVGPSQRSRALPNANGLNRVTPLAERPLTTRQQIAGPTTYLQGDFSRAEAEQIVDQLKSAGDNDTNLSLERLEGESNELQAIARELDAQDNGTLLCYVVTGTSLDALVRSLDEADVELVVAGETMSASHGPSATQTRSWEMAPQRRSDAADELGIAGQTSLQYRLLRRRSEMLDREGAGPNGVPLRNLNEQPAGGVSANGPVDDEATTDDMQQVDIVPDSIEAMTEQSRGAEPAAPAPESVPNAATADTRLRRAVPANRYVIVLRIVPNEQDIPASEQDQEP